MTKREGADTPPAGGTRRPRSGGSERSPEAPAKGAASPGDPAKGTRAAARSAKAAAAGARTGSRTAKAVPKQARAGAGAGETGGPSHPRGRGEPVPSGARRGRGWLWLAVVLLVAGAGGILTWSVWPGRTAESLKALEARVATLEGRISALEVQFAGLPDAKAVSDAEAVAALVAEKAEGLGNRIEEFARTLADIEKRLAEVQESAAAPRPDPAAREAKLQAERNAAELAALKRRVEALQGPAPTAASQPGGLAQAFVVAVGQLREALRGSGPFAAELEVVDRLAGDDPAVAGALAEIEGFADRGIPTVADLRRRFPALAREVVQASQAPDGESWVDKVLSRMAAVATVRRTGEDVPGSSAEAVVARAEARLEADDLSGAVSELDSLSGAAGEAAAAWLEGARARLAAEEALKALHVYAVGQIAQGDGPSP